jgi:hypothetical protein
MVTGKVLKISHLRRALPFNQRRFIVTGVGALHAVHGRCCIIASMPRRVSVHRIVRWPGRIKRENRVDADTMRVCTLCTGAAGDAHRIMENSTYTQDTHTALICYLAIYLMRQRRQIATVMETRTQHAHAHAPVSSRPWKSDKCCRKDYRSACREIALARIYSIDGVRGPVSGASVALIGTSAAQRLTSMPGRSYLGLRFSGHFLVLACFHEGGLSFLVGLDSEGS